MVSLQSDRRRNYAWAAASVMAFTATDFVLLGDGALRVLPLRVAWAALHLAVALLVDRLSDRVANLIAIATAASAPLFLAWIVLLAGGSESPYVLALPMMPLLFAMVETRDGRAVWATGAGSAAGALDTGLTA